MAGRRDGVTWRAAPLSILAGLIALAVPALAQAPIMAPRPAAPAPVPMAPARTPFGLPLATVEVVARYPHDPRAFTQGLLWHQGRLYESLGQPGESEVRRVRLETGRVEARTPIPADQFGEGLALHRGELVSLTWQHGIAHRWDVRRLRPRGDFAYEGEGWGLTTDRGRYLMSDGTAAIRVLDPATFREVGRMTVTAAGRPVARLNELEMVRGELWANVFETPFILRIDPATGTVLGLVDLRPLVREIGSRDPDAVANGIAYDPDSGRLFLTGKRWPTLFEVRLVEPANDR